MTDPTKIIDPNDAEEIQLAESRKIAKEIACRKACGDRDIFDSAVEHDITCPFWDPWKGEGVTNNGNNK